MCCCRPRPNSLIPSRKKPSQVTQKTNALSSSLEEGSAALFSNRAVPAFSDSRSNRLIRRMPRTTARRAYAMSHPAAITTSITISRGTRCANPLARPSHIRLSSWRIISFIRSSFLAVPQLQQVYFQALKHQAERLQAAFYLFHAGMAVLRKEFIQLAAIERNQSLNDVVAADDRLVIRNSKFVNHSRP